MRPAAQESIEAIVTARATSPCWNAPERDLDLLRSELAGCRREIARMRSALDLARARLTQWCEDGGMVHVDLLAELLADMEGDG